MSRECVALSSSERTNQDREITRQDAKKNCTAAELSFRLREITHALDPAGLQLDTCLCILLPNQIGGAWPKGRQGKRGSTSTAGTIILFLSSPRREPLHRPSSAA